MQSARTGGGQANADLTSKLGVTARHKSGHFLMAHAHVIKARACPVQGAHQTADAVTGIAEDALNAPVREAAYDKIDHCVSHAYLPLLIFRCTIECVSGTVVRRL